MKISLDINNGLIISPETEFESDYIEQTFGNGDIKCFVKHGLTPSILLGIKICIPDKNKK
jgi:hypothetical protein